MANKLGLLQIKRGSTADRMAAPPLRDGEPGWDDDQKLLYVGDGVTVGGILIGGWDDPRTQQIINDLLQEIIDRTDADTNLGNIKVGKYDSYRNNDSIALVAGTPVGLTSDGSITRCIDYDTARNFIGIVVDDLIVVGGSGLVQIEGTVNLSVVIWDNVINNPSSGIMTQSNYYLPDGTNGVGEFGKVTNVVPTNNFIKRIGIALSPTALKLLDRNIIKL